MREARRHERGVTLLMVTVSIAILTAVAVEFAFQTRVDLELATHQRDGLRAEYLAKSSIGLARMLLLFQKQLDRTTGALPGAAQGINLQLWRMAKLDCHLLQSVVPQSGEGRRGSSPPPAPEGSTSKDASCTAASPAASTPASRTSRRS